MPYATVYDASAAGFDFTGLIPIVTSAFVVLVVAILVFRKRSGRRTIRWLVLGVAATVVSMAFAGVALDYRNYRLDVQDLESDRAPFVDGVVKDHTLRHGSERFDVDAIRLQTRTSLGGYGMRKGVVTLEDGLPVRIHYSSRGRGRRHLVLRLARPATDERRR